MKIFLGLIIALSFAYGEAIGWHGNFEKALIEAKKEKKDILLLILKKDCQRCKTIFVELFNDKEVQEKVNKKYLPVIAYFEDKNSYPIELFYTQQFPALFFVSYKDESFLNTPLFESFTKKELLNSL